MSSVTINLNDHDFKQLQSIAILKEKSVETLVTEEIELTIKHFKKNFKYI